MTTRSITMLPYRRQGEIDYAGLDFDPDEAAEKAEMFQLLSARLADFNQRPNVFLDYDSFICYDRNDLNVRVSPDLYLAFGVDAQAARPRRLYLPWEAGKPPDWALEIASQSTAREDVDRKPAIYARIGIPEYWRFDPTGGAYHGEPLWGGLLVQGAYQPVELTTGPDGVLKGYSPVLGLSLCWDSGWPRFYDPSIGAYLENWREVEAARADAEARAETAEAELRRLRAQLENRQPE